MYAMGETMGGQQPGAGQPPAAAGGGQVIQQLQQAVDAWEKMTGQIFEMLGAVDPPTQALLGPVVQAGQAIKKKVQQIGQNFGQPPGTPDRSDKPVMNPAEGMPPAGM